MGGCVGGRGGGDGNGGSTPYTHTHTHTHTATHWNKIQKKKRYWNGPALFALFIGRNPSIRSAVSSMRRTPPSPTPASPLDSVATAKCHQAPIDGRRRSVDRLPSFFFVKQSGGGGGGGGVSSLSGSAFQTSHSVGNRRLLGFTAFFFRSFDFTTDRSLWLSAVLRPDGAQTQLWCPTSTDFHFRWHVIASRFFFALVQSKRNK